MGRARRGYASSMTIGGALFLIAVGAILSYAVSDTISGVDLSMIGVILMVVGVIGLVLGLFLEANRRRGRSDPVL